MRPWRGGPGSDRAEEPAIPTDADSIYRPPSSNLERREDLPGDFGSLSRGVEGDFSFQIGDVMREAWELTSGSKGVVVGGFAIFFGISFVAGFVSAMLERSSGGGSTLIGALVQLGGNVIGYGLFAGIYMYGVKRAAHDHSAAFADLFAYFPRLLPLVGLYILQSILTLLGLLLLVLPGIYLAIGYMLATPLLLDKELGIWSALESSRKAVTHVWFQFFGLGLVVGLATALGTILTLGIGGIWLVPWSTLCLGVAYRKVFGYGPEST